MLVEWHDSGPVAQVLQNAVECTIFEPFEALHCIPPANQGCDGCPATDCDAGTQAANENYSFIDFPEQQLRLTINVSRDVDLFQRVFPLALITSTSTRRFIELSTMETGSRLPRPATLMFFLFTPLLTR